MAAASMVTESVMASIVTKRILSVLVISLVVFLQVASGKGSSAGIPDLVAYTGKAFIASFRSFPVYGDPSVNVQLTSSASSTFNRLHSWFTFNTTTKTISGVPLAEDVGWTLLTIKAQCDQGDNLSNKDAYPCTESSDEFKLTVHTLSWSEFLTPRIKSTEPSIQSSLGLSSVGDVSNVEHAQGEHGCGDDSVVASLVLCVSINDLNAQDRFYLVVKLSDFLSIPTSSIILESSSSHTLRAMARGFQMVSAGPGSGDVCSLAQNVELVWVLPCSTVKHLTDFLRVLQHNVDGGRLADEINMGIVGWYVASANPQLTKHNRRRRAAGQHTVFPTPVLTPLRPTSVAVHDDEVILASTVAHWSSSVQLVPESREEMLTRSSSSVSLVITPSSALPSFSSTAFTVSSLTMLHPSTSLLDTLHQVQTKVEQEPVSLTSQSTTSTLHLLKDSNVPTYLFSSVIMSESPLSVITTVFRPKPTSVIASESSYLLKAIPTFTPQEETVGIGRSAPTTHAVLPESEQSLSSDFSLPSSKLSSQPLLFLDSNIMVTSRTVEIIAFPFTSIDTESSLSITPSTYGFPEPSLDAEFSFFEESSVKTESSDEAMSSLDFSIHYTFSHDLSEEIIASIPHEVFEYTTGFESSKFQSKASDMDTDEVDLLITHLLSEAISSPFSQFADIVVVDINVTMTPTHTFSDEITSVLDTPLGSDIVMMSSQVLTESVTEKDLSQTLVIEDVYTSIILHSFSVETDVQSIEPTLNTSSSEFETVLTLEPAVTVIMPSAVSSTSPSWSILSELAASLTTVIAASFTSATAQLVEAQQSATVSPDVTVSAMIEETVAWIPNVPTEGNSSAVPTAEKNNGPYVLNPIKHIISEQGRLLRFAIPHDVFVDKEDGNTSSLTLSLMSASTQELPSGFWLYLESGDQTILTGLPLQQDMARNNVIILLVATDKEGLAATDSITVHITEAPRDTFTHEFIMKFALDYQQFMHNRRNLPQLLHKIAEYFDDSDARFMTVLDVSRGSLVLRWTNNTLTGTPCQMDVIKNLLSKMVRSDGTVKSPFYRHVGSDTNLTEILFESTGSCYVSPATVPTTTTIYFVSDTSRAYGLSVWAHVILPVMIAVLVFVLIILIIVFCNRRRRHRQAVLNVEKEAVSNDRNPIFFPDELEVDDPSLKPREPIVLPTDPHPNNQITPQDLSPSKTSSDQERSSNEDPAGQEGVTSENTETEQERERSGDQKRRKSSKKQKELAKDGGVSASSTLTWDRPNNHYLEEEASSRSSTLNSTKSQESEKRHPRSPPTYWQSQSDPPPYRLPPPYLTETTSQV